MIRTLQKTDIPKILRRYFFPWSTPDKSKALWDQYYQDQKEGIRTVGVIDHDQEILGYGSLLRKSQCLSFKEKHIPEISAIWIDEGFRRHGLGTALIEWLENLARKEGFSRIGIGVGLYSDYGPAQRLYFKLGYIPDGNGITYKGEVTVPGKDYPLDDDLILWLVKNLNEKKDET
jgi:GNAT superfamily N-acetyltransferase